MRNLLTGQSIIGASFVYLTCCCVVNVYAQTPDGEPTVVMPATTRAQAHDQAKVDSGRNDPLAPVTGFKHFPSHDASFVSAEKVAAPGKVDVLKNAPGSAGPLSATNPLLKVPPPPPNVSSYPASENELPVSELPAPPDRPSVANLVKLTGIVGDKAIFSVVDQNERMKNHWPKAFLLGAGDHFETISVISVGAHNAVLEENGERIEKNLERIR